VPLLFAISPLAIVAFSLLIMWENIVAQNWGNAAFAGLNAFAASWAIVAYIGIVNTIVDIWLGLTNWLYVEKYPTNTQPASLEEPAIDWQAVLYHGQADGVVPHAAVNEVVVHPASSPERPVAI
jgi:hypothetical protein